MGVLHEGKGVPRRGALGARDARRRDRRARRRRPLRPRAGGKDFPALANQLDRNSVELSQAIGSVFGKQAGNQFLNGKLLWRDHIRFFVNYTVGLAKKDRAMQNKAVGNLNGDVLSGAIVKKFPKRFS